MSLEGTRKRRAKRNRYLGNDEDKKVRKSALTAASHGEPCPSEERLKQRGYKPEQIHLYNESYEESAGSPETRRQRTLKRKAQQDKKYQAKISRLPKQSVSEQVPQISSEEPILTLEIETWEEFQTQTLTEHTLSEQTVSMQHIDDMLSNSFSTEAQLKTEEDHFWEILFNDGMYFNFNTKSGMTEYAEPENTLASTQLSYSPLKKVDL